MTKEDIKILEQEIDAVIEKFDNNQFVSQDFYSYSKTVRNAVYKCQNLYRKSRECQVIDCKEKSVKRSHSIPKTSILQNICSNGHLFMPQFDSSGGFPKISMKKIGLSNASVFPGFCEKHENLFASFESNGEINTAKKAVLQTYRTICRERVEREIRLEINKIAIQEYKKKINEEAESLIKKSLLKHSQLDGIKKIEIDGNDLVLESLNQLDGFLSKPLSQFELFEKNIYSWLLNLSDNNDLIVNVVNLDFHIPVSICGFGNYDYMVGDDEKNNYLFVNVMPKKDSTDVVCVALEKNITTKKFLDFSLSNPLYILNMLESFMVNGTDHWYINPDYWEDISKKKREKISQDILLADDSFLDEYNISIFDDIRRILISTLEKNIKKDGRKILKHETERIKHENNKLKSKTYEIICDKEILAKKIFEMFNQIKAKNNLKKI